MDAHVNDIELKRALEHAGLHVERSSRAGPERHPRSQPRVDQEAKEHRQQQLAEEHSQQPEADREALSQYLGEAHERLARAGMQLKFTFHEDTGDLQVELINSEDDKVVRKIPPDELLELSASLKEMAGAFLNRSV